MLNFSSVLNRANASNTSAQAQPLKDDYMSLGQAYSHLNNMFKAYETETDAVKKQQQGMDAIDFRNTLNAAIADPNMPYYNPYTRATNYNIVDNLKKYYNIDLSSGITQSTINDLKKKVDYSKISYNYGGSIASNTKDSNQQLAYYISMLEDDEAITQKAEQELNSLQNDVWMLVKRGYSDNDIAKKIDMSKYPTLTKMDEGRQTNTPLTLNRRVNYSQDYLPAYIWAARNDYQLNSDEAYVNALIGSYDGVGEHYIPRSSSYASLDPSSEYYAPYGQTTTLFDLGSKYKTTSFDRKWLDEHKSELLNGDSTSQKEYTKILAAVENADAATQELKKLNAWRDQMVASGKSADEITALLTNAYDGEKSLLEEEYPTLAKMENKRTRGAALELGYAVDFSLPVFKENTRLAARKRDINTALRDREAAEVLASPTTQSEIDAVRAAAGSNEGFSAMDSVAADFSVAAFKQGYADKTEIEYNTAVSNLEDDIVAYKNGKAFKDLSEDAQRFIKTNPELFEGIRNWESYEGAGDTVTVKYNAVEQTLTNGKNAMMADADRFTSTGIGKTAADAILYADDAVRDGLLSPEDNAAFLIGVAEAKEKAANAGMSLEDYLNSDESVRREVVGGMYEVVAVNDEAMAAQRKELRDSFVNTYMQSQQNEWNGTATDDEASFLEQVNNYNVDLSKDEYYLGVLNDNDEYARELTSELTDGIEEIQDARDYTPVQSYMAFSNDGSKLIVANIADAANAVYTADMRAARWAGFKNLTDFYEAYPELEARAQERAKAAASEKLAEYQEFNDTFSLLWKQSAEQGTIQGTNAGEYALQKGEEGVYLQDSEGNAYDLKDEDDVYELRSDSSGDSSNGQIGLGDIRNYIQQSVRADYEENNRELQRDANGNLIEPAAKEDQWSIYEAVPKVMWQGLKSGVVTVPLNFAQAMEYFFYYKSNEDLEAELRSTVSREDYRSKVEYDISDESGVIPDEYRRKMLQTKLYGDAEQGIAPYSGDIYDFGYDVDKASLLKYIESRQAYLSTAREDVQKYAPYMLDIYDDEVSVVQNVINMGLMTAGSAIGGGSIAAKLGTSMLVYGLPEGAEMGRTLEEKFGLSHNAAAAWALGYAGLIAGMETVMFDKLEEGILNDNPDTLLGEKKVLARSFATKLVKDPGFAQSAAKYFAGNLCTATLSTPFEAIQEGVEALASNAVVSVATRNVELKPGETYTPESFLGVTIDAAPVSFWLGFISGTIGDTKSVLAAKKLAKQRSVNYKQALDVTEALKADVEKAKAEYQEKGAGYYSDLVQQQKYAVDNFAKSMAEINQGAEVQQAQQAQTAYEEQQSKVSDAQEAYNAAATQAQAQAEALMAEDIPSADTIAEMQRIQGELDSAAEKLKNENSLLEKTKKVWQDKQAQVDEIKKAALKQAEVDAQMRVAQERAEADIAEKQRAADKAQAQTDALIDDMAKDIQAAVGREGEDIGAVKDKIKSNADKLGKYLQSKRAQIVENFNKNIPGWTLKFDVINDRGTRGYVDKESRTIYLNSNMGTLDQIRATEGHELTHVLESLPDYGDVQNAIFDAYYQGNTERLTDDLAAIKARYDLQADKTGNEGFRLNTEEAQRQELLGDLVGQLLFKSDPKILDHIAVKNQGVVRRMLRWVSDKCKELWIRVSKKGGKEMAQAYREMVKIRDTFADSLSRAAQMEEQGQNNAADVAAAQTEQAQQQTQEAPVAETAAEAQGTQETPVERAETPVESPEVAPVQTVEETAAVDSAPQNEGVAVDYTPVDASSLESIQQRMQDIQRAEAEEKQITLTNVTAETAAALDRLRETNGISYFRAFTNDPALRSQYSWLDYQVQAKSVSQYLDALRNPDVDNVVMVGEDSDSMPRFAYQDGEWSTDYRGATNKQKQLARMIKAQGLEAEYIAKSPIERTTENADYVANRDAGSRAMWEAKAEEENATKTETREPEARETPELDGRLAPETPTAIKERVSNLLTTEAAPETVKVADIQVDPETYQFKGDVDERGVTKPLTGDYKPGLSQPLILHERLDGTLYVADGHHRLDLAKRNGVDTVSAVVLKEADGYTPADVRVYAALRNLSQGRGTSVDAAKLFRDAGFTQEELAYYGLSTNETIVEQGMYLAALNEDVFDRVASGEISVYTGALLGEMFPNDVARQNTFLQMIYGKNLTQQEQRYLAEDIQRAQPIQRAEGEQLSFDDEFFATIDTNLAERAQIVSGLKNRLAKEANQFSTLSKQKTVDKVSAVGQNVLDAEANKAHAQTAQAANALLSTYHLTGETNQQVRTILDKYATELATNPKMSKNAAINAAYNEIMAIAEGGMTSEVRWSQKADDATSDRAGLEGQGRTGEVSSNLAAGGTGGVLEGGRGTVETAQGGKNLKPQYSVQFDENERLNILREFAKDINSQELYKYTIGERLNAIFRGTALRPSFDQLNPVRIIQNLAAELGTSTYTADLSALGDDAASVLSYYDTRARSLVVDKNSAADLGVTLYGLGQFVYDKCASKLNPDTYNRASFGQEFADYMTHDNADCNPDFITDLTLALDAKTKQAVDAARQQVITYSFQTNLQKAMNMIRDRAEERAGKKTLTGQLRQFYVNNINAAYAASMIDYLTGTQELSLEASFLPHAKYMSESIITRDYVLPDGTRVGVAFNQMLQNAGVTRENEKIVGAYMLAEHDIYSMQLKPPKPVFNYTEQKNRSIMAEAKAKVPNIENIVRVIRSWWDTFMTDWYLDQGFVTEEEFARWHAENPYYVPAFDFEAEETNGTVKERKGSTKEKINPFDAYVEYIQKIVNRVAQNNVAKTFHNLYQTNSGLGVIARQIPSTVKDIRNLHADVMVDSVPDAVMGDVRARLEEKGASERRENGMSIFANANKQTGLEEGTLWVYLEDGTKVKYVINDVPLYNLLKGSGDNTYRKVGRILSSVTNTMARLTTGLNPLFSGKNAIRDFSKSVNYGSWAPNYGSGLVKWFQNFGYTFSNYMKENFGGEVDTDYADYRAMGGGESERFDTHKSTRKLKKALYGDTTLDKVWKAVTLPVIGINNIVEMNSRLVEYRFGKHDLSTAEGRKKAFMAAMEVTTDFQRGGQGGVFQFISKATPFFNATVQGIDQQARMFGRGERERLGARLAKTVVNNLISGALQVAMIGMFGTDRDKDLYGLALDGMKNDFLLLPTHWFVKNPERPFLRIPLAQDALSKAAFAFGRKLIAGELPDEYQDDFTFDLKEAIMDILSNQLPDSTIFSPILDVLTNRTWNDTQITSNRNLQKSEVNQTNESMPQIFNDISAFLSANRIHGKFTSPNALRYLFSQYTGVIGQVLLPMLSRDANGDANLLRGLYTSVRNSFTLDPTYTNWVNGAYDDLYEKLDKTIKDKNMIGGQLKAGMSEQDATEAYEAARALIGSKGTVTQINNEISALYDEINEIARSNADDAPQLSQDKRMEIVLLKKRAVELMQEWSDKYCADTGYLITLKTQPTVKAYTRAQSVAAKYGVDAFGEIPDYLSYGANYAESIGKNTEAYSPHPTYSRTSKGVTKAVPEDKQSEFEAAYLKVYEDAFNGKGGADYFNSITNEETLQKELKDLHTKAQKAAEQRVPMVEVTE